MLRIETCGTWREMGRQYGEALRDELRQCMAQFSPWLLAEPAKYAPAIEDLRGALRPVCPELLDESVGIAEGAELDEDLTLGYRFFNEVRARLAEECSAVCLCRTDKGPLLGRNCDLMAGFEAEVQLCQVRRADDGPACVLTTYVGLTGGQGLNEYGLGIAGASAGTEAVYGKSGLPGAALCHLLLHRCRDVSEAYALLSRHPFLGKPMNLVAADAGGHSVLLEFAPGRTAVPVPRRADRDWQACTNFFISGEIPIRVDPRYLGNAYARYGRIVHQLGEGLAEYSLAGLERLLTDIAQPGLCCPEETTTLRTAYSQVLDLGQRAMHLCPGHPAALPYQLVAL